MSLRSVLTRPGETSWRPLVCPVIGYALAPLALPGYVLLTIASDSYDPPGWHVAWVTAAVLGTLLLSVALAALYSLAIHKLPTWAQVVQFLLFLPLVAGLLYCLTIVNRVPVYLAALGFPALLLVLWLRRPPVLPRLLAALAVLAVLGVIVYSQRPAYRLARYSFDLRYGCWCCGVKERAVHELLRLGPSATDTLVSFAASGRQERAWVLANLPTGRASPVRALVESLPVTPPCD